MSDELQDAQPTERVYKTNSEKKFFANQEASSLPITSTEPPPQEPTPAVAPVEPVVVPPVVETAVPPVVPVEPKVDEPPATPAEPVLDETDFSADLPGTVPEDGVILQGAKHPDSPLPQDAPLWQQDAFNRLQADTSISAEDKKTIAELPPTAWDKARRWQSDTRLLGQFRNPEVPISTVFETLRKQSKERSAEFEIEALNRLLTSGESMESYSGKHPHEYAQLMSAMVSDHSDFVATVLKKKGFNVVKAEPFDKQKILDKIKSHPMYETFAETDIASMVENEINELAERVGTNEVTPDELAAELAKGETPVTQTTNVYNTVRTAVTSAQNDHWLKAIGDGLQASGIKPATQAELTKNPAAAHLKTVLYNAALHGLDGVISDWDDHSAKWGETQPGFNETFKELQTLLQSGDIPSFHESAPALNPFYFEFGKKRAGTALIQNLYRAVDKMLSAEAPPAPPPLTPQVPATIDGQAPPTQPRGRTLSERRYFASIGK